MDTSADAIDRIAELINDDNSVRGEAQMQALIGLIDSEASLSSTAEDLIIAVLLATPKPLLLGFSHSDALKRMDEWLAASSSETRTLQLLSLLALMPMSVEALTKSGVGKTVNKLRKATEMPVKDAAIQLVKDWKSVATPAVPAPAPAPAPSAKRPLPADSSNAEKRPKASSSAALEDDNSLDSALSAAAPRKASIKPDNLKARRPVKPMSLAPATSSLAPTKLPSPTSAAATSAGGASAKASAPSGGAPERTSSLDRKGSSDAYATPMPRPNPLSSELSFEVPNARVRSQRRRVSWAPASSLVEERTYTVEDKKAVPTRDWKDQLHAEVEAERKAILAQRSGNIDVAGVGAAASAMAAAAPGGSAYAAMGMLGAAPAPVPSGPRRPQPRIPWRMPTLLDEKLWPIVKGDLSTEKDTQRRRRAAAPEASAFDENTPIHEPPPADNFPTRDDAHTHVMPFDKPAPPPAAEPPTPAAGAMLGGGAGGSGGVEVSMLQNLLASFSGGGGPGAQQPSAMSNGMAGGTMGGASMSNNGLMGLGAAGNAIGGNALGATAMGATAMGANAIGSSSGLSAHGGSGGLPGLGGGACGGGMPGLGGGGMPGIGGPGSSGGGGGMPGIGGPGSSGGLPGIGGGGSLPGLSGSTSGAMSGGASSGSSSSGAAGLTEKLALQHALQMASTGTMGFMQGGAQRATSGGGMGGGGMGGGGMGGGGIGSGGVGGVGGMGSASGNFRQAPINATHHNYRTKPCRYFLAGMCKNGDACTFLHAREGGQDSRGGGGIAFGQTPAGTAYSQQSQGGGGYMHQQSAAIGGGVFNQSGFPGQNNFSAQHAFNM